MRRTIAANPEKRKHFMEPLSAKRHEMIGDVRYREVIKRIINSTFYISLLSTFG